MTGRARSESQPLCHPAGDAQSRERARALAEREGIEVARTEARTREQAPDHRREALGMLVGGEFLLDEEFVPAQQRGRAKLGGSLDGKEIQGRPGRFEGPIIPAMRGAISCVLHILKQLVIITS